MWPGNSSDGAGLSIAVDGPVTAAVSGADGLLPSTEEEGDTPRQDWRIHRTATWHGVVDFQHFGDHSRSGGGGGRDTRQGVDMVVFSTMGPSKVLQDRYTPGLLPRNKGRLLWQ